MLDIVLLVLVVVAVFSSFFEARQRNQLLNEIEKLKEENSKLRHEIEAWKLKDWHNHELIERYT